VRSVEMRRHETASFIPISIASARSDHPSSSRVTKCHTCRLLPLVNILIYDSLARSRLQSATVDHDDGWVRESEER
jgi:hypothetical protein